VEPLQDSLPDRYAIESDDSEDDIGQNAYPDAQKKSQRATVTYSAEFVWNEGRDSLSGRETYVAIGQAGLTWASGVHLGNSVAQVRVNEEKASTFTSIYTKSQLYEC
jgi:hypothetical protein